MLKRFIIESINPLNWERQIRHFVRLIKDVIKHKSFHHNPNTKAYWDQRLAQVEGFWRDENYLHILDLLPAGKEFTLLDIGCAVGDGCLMLKKQFPKAQITGVDISEVGIAKATQKSDDIKYAVLDILKDPLPQTYDYILIIETLEHFDEPFQVINKCLKHVRQSIIVSVPYEPHYTGKNLGSKEHCYSFNEKTFSKYNSTVVRITDFIETSQSKCIIYQIRPHQNS